MFSHRTASCKQPRCLTCGSKTHSTDAHPAEEKPNCVNCKGDHPSSHKECNARRNRMGLKPIPTDKTKPKTGAQNNKQKGKGRQPPSQTATPPETNLDIGLSNEELSNLMRVDASPTAMKENTARTIHSHAMHILANPTNTGASNTSQPSPSPGTPAQNTPPNALNV